MVQHDDDWMVDHQAPGSVAIAHACRVNDKLDALEASQWMHEFAVVSRVDRQPGP